MATNTETKVMVGSPKVGGAIYRAPLGTALPTDATTALAAEYIAQGHASPDGLERAINKAYKALKVWGAEEIGKIRTELSVGMKFTLVQSLSEDVLKSAWGDDAVTVTAADATNGNRTTIAWDGTEPDASIWVFEMAFKGRKRRIVLGNAENTTESFTESFTDEDMVGLPFELSAYKDATGKWFHDYTDDGLTTA